MGDSKRVRETETERGRKKRKPREQRKTQRKQTRRRQCKLERELRKFWILRKRKKGGRKKKEKKVVSKQEGGEGKERWRKPETEIRREGKYFEYLQRKKRKEKYCHRKV